MFEIAWSFIKNSCKNLFNSSISQDNTEMNKISEAGIEFIKKHEGCELTSYQDEAGVWTIGYGSIDGVTPNMTITQNEADKRLADHLEHMCFNVDSLIRVAVKQCQFDALCSFAYNLGLGALTRSTLLKLVNRSEFKNAADEFPKWDMAGGHISQGLVKRRADERKLFLS